MVRRWAGFAVLGAALAALCAASPAPAACTLGKMAELPVAMTGLEPLVSLKINGEDVSLVADTGAFFSSITPAAAAHLHLTLHPAPPYLIVSGVNGEADIALTTVHQLIIADQSIPDVQFIVGGGETGNGSAGLLGQNVLGLADGDYDLANGVIRLIRTHGCQGPAVVYWDQTKPYSVLDIKGPDYNSRLSMLTPSPVGWASINGAKIRVMFDSGFSLSALSLRAAARAGITPQSPGATPGGAFTGIGRKRIQTWIVPVASFKVGDEEIKNTKLRIGDFTADATDMWLGADFFLSHHIYVANSQRKIYFTYNGGPIFNLGRAASEPGARDGAPAEPPGGAEPSDAAGFGRRGEAFLSRRDYDKAILDLTHAIALSPNEPRFRYDRGLAYANNKQPFLAMGDFDQALKLKPDDVPALLARTELRLAGRDRSGALADLNAADHAAPKEADIRLTLGVIYNRIDQFAQALTEFDFWIQTHGEDAKYPNALQGRCWARAQLGQDLQKALTDCNGAVRADPKNGAALADRGLVRLRLGDLDHAIADYDAALTLQPKNAWALYGRGLAKTRKGLMPEGQADIAAATAFQPKLAALFKERGIAP